MGAVSKKHHYIPAFYLKRWASADGLVCEYSRPINKVRPQRRHPNATGFRIRLYSIKGLPENAAHIFEDAFFKPVDTQADLALRHLETIGGEVGWTSPLRSAWSKFLHSLILRCPEDVEKFVALWLKDTVKDPGGKWEARYQEIRKEGWPETLFDYMKSLPDHSHYHSAFTALAHLIDGENVGQHMNNMVWGTFDFTDIRHTLLTSDRPIVRTNGLQKEGGHLALAIGPRRLFVAAKDVITLEQIAAAQPDAIVKEYNTQIVGAAVKYVWGQNDSQLRFVENRMSRTPIPSIVDSLGTSKADT